MINKRNPTEVLYSVGFFVPLQPNKNKYVFKTDGKQDF